MSAEKDTVAAFVAAMQSTAFVIRDLRACIEMGLAVMPVGRCTPFVRAFGAIGLI